MSLVASVLQLDRAAIKALCVTDPYSLHRVVYGLYPDVRDDAGKAGHEPSGILHADQGGDFHGRRILLLADRPPADHAEGGFGEVRSKVIPIDFLDHARYRFKVIVNPTRRDSASRKLLPVKGRDAVAAWFAERGPASWGFRIDLQHLQVDRIDVLRFRDKAQRDVTLAQAHVQGQLDVIDRERFRHSFASGIGRGRSFGCGLLQVVPLVDNPFV
ncbi:MAG: type I-E CRISPR-associated protein Cas6/Cse3/CasE [Xanthomonadales bacterium]|nr:type I-E CRISPR-associated protein Cas6/Cse3/CasE [Xanthomonadales bacterium]